MTDGPIELVRLEGDGNSVVLRISGADGDVLTGGFVIDTPFVKGALQVWVFPGELREWQEALDALDAGQDAVWREFSRGPSMVIERDVAEERARVTVKDPSMSLTSVTVTVPLVDSWFDDAYERLESVRKTWPSDEG
ncbi:hypothetical protein BN159_1151 [Streptomyces davaonensis JCM 4913]|uniref:Uncharacterized protein n=1 Tax=Streptomyces davaonensis (strain DSM 101723 / JCM 4913 / KCC S-0913 / 768) TaxID=1214101 RepID=K4QXG5_STRDJ|nr:DUF5959 family protein [Streptomyces davaonensis]CCK25530.1 hypothetical protein BN159_1151 [Streptomyces davaonensis JCM 4913]